MRNHYPIQHSRRRRYEIPHEERDLIPIRLKHLAVCIGIVAMAWTAAFAITWMACEVHPNL